MNHQYWTWWRNWAAYKLSFICCVSTIDLKIAHDSTWDVLQGALKSDLNLHDAPKLHQGILVWCRSWSTIWPFRSSLANDLMLSLRQRVWYVVVRDTTPDPSLGVAGRLQPMLASTVQLVQALSSPAGQKRNTARGETKLGYAWILD